MELKPIQVSKTYAFWIQPIETLFVLYDLKMPSSAKYTASL